MILNFKIKFPWGDYTWFVIRIMNCLNNYSVQYTSYYDPKNGEKKYIELHGQKPHSIREDKTNRWKPGMKIHFTTGSRSKNYKCFAESKCISTQVIEIKEIDSKVHPIIKEALTLLGVETDIHYIFEEYVPKLDVVFRKRFQVTIDGRVLSVGEINTLAKNDGFNNTHDFFRWFNKSFTGKIIHWTDLKY